VKNRGSFGKDVGQNFPVVFHCSGRSTLLTKSPKRGSLSLKFCGLKATGY